MSGNVFRFSASKDGNALVDMNAVDEVVSLSKNAAELGKQLEAELATQNADTAQDGLKKFIRSQIEATANDGQTRHVHVMDADALADLVIAKGLEHVEVKCESHIGKDNWELCKDLGVVYLNSDQPNFEALKEQAIAHGVKKVESTLSKAVHCEELTELMRVESQITGNPAAVFFPHAYDKAQAIKLVELNGAISAKAWAKVGGAVAIGSNVVDVLTGDKTVKEAAKDIATSAAKEVLIDYAKSQIIATAVTQPVVQSAIKKFGGDAVMKAVGQTSLGATAVSTANNVLLSSTGLVAAAIKGVGSTTAGFVSTVGFTGTAGAITAGTAAITGGLATAAALVTPLAPIALGGAALYGVGKLLKKIF